MAEPATCLRFTSLSAGDPAPWFRQRSTSNPAHTFDSAGGRYVLLCFFGTAARASARERLAWIQQHRAFFDDAHLCCFGVSVDPADEATGRVRASLPGIRHFWDHDKHVSRLFGAWPDDAPQDASDECFRPMWVLLNPDLQVRGVLPFRDAEANELDELLPMLRTLPPVDRFGGMEMHAPVLLLPDIFEPQLCRALVEAYDRHGGEVSGFMRDVHGKTVPIHDTSHKVRRDHLVNDPALREPVQARIQRRVVPAIQRAFNFNATRLERYLVACYDANEGAHFRRHRDNTTFGTAHRRFALSINLSDDFEGGALLFPEYGSRRYKPPIGAGVVFSCSLLHAVEPVRAGRRYAFLPFLFDEAAAAQRDANRSLVALDG